MPTNPRKPSPSAEKILVIRHGAFGDIVQTDGALRDIRTQFPHAEIVLLTTAPFRKLLARCPHINRILIDDRAPLWKLGALWALRSALKKEAFDRVFDLQKTDRTDLYRRIFLKDTIWSGRVAGHPAASAIEGYVAQLRSANVEPAECTRPNVEWMADDVSAKLVEAGVRQPYITLIPGCSTRHPQKRWPYYDQLAKALIARGYDVVTAPGPDEIELCKRIPGHTLLGPNGFLNWFELAGVLKEACFVVGNDTGPSHVASCLGKPGLALFGPHTSAARTGICRGEFAAIEVANLADLDVQTVLEAVLSKLPAQENSV